MYVGCFVCFEFMRVINLFAAVQFSSVVVPNHNTHIDDFMVPKRAGVKELKYKKEKNKSNWNCNLCESGQENSIC